MAEHPPLQQTRSPAGDSLVSLLTFFLDAAAICGSFLFSYWLRFGSPLFEHLGYVYEEAPPFRIYMIGSFVITTVWLTLFQSRRMYSPRRSVSLADEFFNIVRVVSVGMLIVAAAAFLYREFSFSRLVFFLLWVSSTCFIFAGRAFTLWLERKSYRRGRHLRNAIVLGNEGIASDLYERLHMHPSFGFRILGYFSDSPARKSLRLAEAEYLGPVAAAPQFIRLNRVDLAFIALSSQDHKMLFEFISECEGINIDFMMVPDVLEVLTSGMKLTELEGVPLLKIKSIPFSLWGRVIKRSFDLLVSSILLLLLSPLFLIVGILIKLDSKGPVFFKQERIGRDGRDFVMYKFRSMKSGSEAADEQAGLGIRDDARRTHVGAWLRKLSLDEVPQLLNVLRGEMSLVGPRPERTGYVRKFEEIVPKYVDRHRVKTGITGWAQVHGFRGDTSIDERVRFDLYYIENWSLVLDIKILLRTIRAALNSERVD